MVQTHSIPAETPILQPSSMISRTDVRTVPLCASHTAPPIPPITTLRQGTPRPLGLIVTRPFHNRSHQTLHQTPPLVGHGSSMLVATRPGPIAVSASGVRHVPSPAVSVALSPRPLVRNTFVVSGQQREMMPPSSSTSAHLRPPVVLTATARPISETVRLPYNIILSAPVSTAQVWPRGSTVLVSKAPFIHGIPLPAVAVPELDLISKSPLISRSYVATGTCSYLLGPANRTQKITRMLPQEPRTVIIPPTRCLTTDKATTMPMSFLPIAPKRFHPSPDDFDRSLIFVNTVHEDRLPMEVICPLPAAVSYPRLENAKVVVETCGCIHTATVFIQETLETVTMLTPVEETALAHHAPTLEWCISTTALYSQLVQFSPSTLPNSVLMSHQPLKRKRKHTKAMTAANSGVVEPPAKMAHLQFTVVCSDHAASGSASLFPKPGDSTTSPPGVVQAPVLLGPVFPIEDLHRLRNTDPPTSIRPVLDTPYPFLHSFNLVLHKIIPRRPLVSSVPAVVDDTMDVDVDSHRPPVIRPSCRLLASIGRGLVCEQFRAHSDSVSHRSPYRRLAGLKPKEGQSKDSIDEDDNLQMRDHHGSFPQAKEDKALRTLAFFLSTPEVRHLAWRPKHLGVAYESTCVRRGCPFVADSFFSLSRHLEHGHWLLVSLNQSSQAASFSRPVDLARTHRIMSRKLLRCGGAASVKYSCPVCSAYFVAAHGLQTHVSKCYAQGRLRPRQPPAPSPISGLLKSLMTPGSGGEEKRVR
ncbi:unnamed protein product [Schistocephalus solidus]|uniref:C2H2-type domain-containing protein n=1 Tax=Schistocephalus solidus TaxID=70667 RepID=A0A183TM88_SCHSO|nr:unnamed protein product [Schistocephalus solidus]